MDEFIARCPATRDADLMLCATAGVAWQADMRATRVRYDGGYFEKVAAYEHSTIARAVNAGRCAMLARHLQEGASVLDVGAGTGAFVREANAWGFEAKGFEILDRGAARLRAEGLFDDDPALYDAVTLWDTVEHMENPSLTLRRVARDAHLFLSVPIFADLRRIRESKHYRPGEHLYYWTAPGLVNWLYHYGYRLLEESSHEMEAGRECIGAFAFVRDVKEARNGHARR